MRNRLAWLGEQVGWLIGDVACLLLLIIFLPLIPIFETFDAVRRLHEDE